MKRKKLLAAYDKRLDAHKAMIEELSRQPGEASAKAIRGLRAPGSRNPKKVGRR